MAYRDRSVVSVNAGEWIQMGLDRGFSPKALLHALQAQMIEKSRNAGQAGVSLAPGNLATARRDWFQNWYTKLGFTISIPLPPVSEEEFKRRKELGQSLFCRPSTSEVSYEALMKGVGQGEHWTVADKNNRKKIVWEPAKDGYWFWAEVAENCPRLDMSWNTLTGKQKLNPLSLEEYMIVWWAMRTETNSLLDTRTWSWLRTRFGQGALLADGYGGRVRVDGWLASDLAYSYGRAGGRVAEVVKM